MKDQLRALLISAKILQFCADIFAVFGIFMFAYLYFHTWRNSPVQAIHDPFFVVTVLIPFLPAAALAFLASRKRRQIRALLEQSGK